jgi:methylenetetrahydrofolate dehydrogenase (NADP+)/methenyltetrahydrofolate cyclohydrolase
MELIDGNAISQAIIEELKEAVSKLEGNKVPCIAVVRVGEDPASVFYVNKKVKTAEKIGMESQLHILPENSDEETLLALIDRLNADPTVHGILVQAPLPGNLDEVKAFNRVAPEKDVDGLGVVSMGKLVQEDPTGFASCTPSGVIELITRSGIDIEGKHVVIVGRSLLVGKSAALLFVKKGKEGNATVTVCHSRTKDLPSITRQADILVAAIGKPNFVTKDMVKPGAVVLDVGINRVDDATKKRGYRIVGDVDFQEVSPECSHITPVPGGVGPMTVAMLMKNTYKAFKLQTTG